MLAGFSLPAIIVFASNTYPGPPGHGIILSLLVTATGLFMASIQLTSPLVDNRYEYAGSVRASLTVLGICAAAAAIILLGEPAMHQWYGILALIAIFIGSVAPAVLLIMGRLFPLMWQGAGSEAGSPRRLRLVRDGGTITGYDATEGRHRTLVGAATLPVLTSTMQAGFFAAAPSNGNATLATGVFRHIGLS